MTPAGFPHSDISGSACACHSPKLFAACHVLHRLSAPRHPPSTLNNLTIKCLELMRSACLGLARLSLSRMSTSPAARPPSYSCYFLYSLILLSMISSVAKTCAALLSENTAEPRLRSVPTGGADRDRTDDLLNANQALSQAELQPRMSARTTDTMNRSQSTGLPLRTASVV